MLCCVMLRCVVLCCIVLCCVVLCCVVVCCVVLWQKIRIRSAALVTQSMQSLGEKFCGVDRFILQVSTVFGGQ